MSHIDVSHDNNGKQERLKSNIKLRVCVVKNMCGSKNVWLGSIPMVLVGQNVSKIIFGVS